MIQQLSTYEASSTKGNENIVLMKAFDDVMKVYNQHVIMIEN